MGKSASRSSPPTASTPRRLPKRSLPRAGPTWYRWPGPSLPTPTSSTRRRQAAPTRSTPASPATRPVWITSSKAGCFLPGQPARLPGNRTRSSKTEPREENRRRWRRPGRHGLRATAAERGHQVTLFDAAAEIGGQFNLARRIPGKEEFSETLRYFERGSTRAGVDQRIGQDPYRAANSPRLVSTHVVLATGIVPRRSTVPGQ